MRPTAPRPRRDRGAKSPAARPSLRREANRRLPQLIEGHESAPKRGIDVGVEHHGADTEPAPNTLRHLDVHDTYE
jgi:hypothetical protein